MSCMKRDVLVNVVHEENYSRHGQLRREDHLWGPWQTRMLALANILPAGS